MAGYLIDGCNSRLLHEDNIFYKFGIWQERHIQMRKPYKLPSWIEKSSLYNDSVGIRTHDIPHSIASNMAKGVTCPLGQKLNKNLSAIYIYIYIYFIYISRFLDTVIVITYDLGL